MDKLVEPEVLKQGDSPVIWTSKENPVTSFLTRVVSAAFACGFDLIGPKYYQHHVLIDEDADDDPEAATEGTAPARNVMWGFRGDQRVTFRPIPAEETITVQEFRRRFEDLDWVARNPDHPISYMRALLEQSRKTVAKASMPPALRIRRGDSEVIAPPGATEEQIEEAFEDLAKALAGN